MALTNNCRTIRLYDLLKIDGGEDFFSAVSNSFESKNADVENFLRNKAVAATRLNAAATYLVVSYDDKNFDILGYFSLATKMLTLRNSALASKERRAISRFGYFDESSQSYNLPAILIAQFGRNFNEKSKSIKGAALMDIAIKQVENILNLTSGKAVFLECEQHKKLIDFYAENGFQSLNNTIISRNNKKLTQLFMIL